MCQAGTIAGLLGQIARLLQMVDGRFDVQPLLDCEVGQVALRGDLQRSRVCVTSEREQFPIDGTRVLLCVDEFIRPSQPLIQMPPPLDCHVALKLCVRSE